MTSSRRICIEWAVLGPDLKLSRKVVVEISSKRIENIEEGWSYCDDKLDEHILTPPLFNAHTHPMDRAWAGYGLGMDISNLVSPSKGIKYRLLEKALESDPKIIAEALHRFSIECISSGVVAIAAIAEMGREGAELVSKELWVPHILLPQPHPSEIHSLDAHLELLEEFRALAMNTALDLGREELEELLARSRDLGAYVQIHVSETSKLYSKRDFELVKNVVSIHCTYLSAAELIEHASRVRAIVACPRSNALLVSRQPSYEAITHLAKKGYAVGLGTDNASWQDPSTLEEARFAVRNGLRDARVALYLATIGNARAMGIDYRGIDIASLPIALVHRVSPATNPINALLTRATSTSMIMRTRIMHLPLRNEDTAKKILEELRELMKQVALLNPMCL